MPIEKLTPITAWTDQRLDQLKSEYPQCFVDGKVNKELLLEVFGGVLEDEAQEHFGLFWPGKREARRLAAMPSKGTLIPQPGAGVDEDNTHNLFIEGDNLEVLKLLQKSYAGRVKMIYIDPPYNTGNDFIYEDDFREPTEDYFKKIGAVDEENQLLTTNRRAEGRFHSNWLNMMYPRISLARHLLRDDGVIFVSIDDNEASNLRNIMSEIFGEENYIATLYIQVRYPEKTLVEDADFHKSIEQVLIFSKMPGLVLNKVTEEYTLDKFIWKFAEKGKPNKTVTLGGKKVEMFYSQNYEIIQDNPSEDNLKEIWATGKILDGNSSGRFFRDYITGRYEEDGYGAIYKVYGIGDDKFPFRYFTGPKREGATKGKYYQGVPNSVLEDLDNTKRTSPIPNFYNLADNFGNCRHEGGVDFRSGKKPIEFIKMLLRFVTKPGDDQEIILDFFAGSCSTAHAVLDLSIEDNRQRNFIVVQIPEEAKDSGYETIAELGKERIRKTINGYVKDRNGQMALDDNVDFGFKCLEFEISNFKTWNDFEGKDSQKLETLFSRYESPLIDDWKSENLLSEILLLQGFPLDSQVRSLPEFKANEVQQVTSEFVGHHLYICVDKKVKAETVAKINLRPEDILVCLDSALSDEAKVKLADQCNLKVI